MATAVDATAPFVPQYEPREALLEAFCRAHDVSQHVLPPAQQPGSGVWPSVVSGMAWTAGDLGDSHITHLTDGERREIADACTAYAASGTSLDHLRRDAFHLPLLAEKLAAVRKDLHNGLGLSILRGLDLSSSSTRESFAALAGLASHVSQLRGQQSGGKMVVHMVDLSETGRAALPAPYRNSPLPLHTDPAADVVAMLVLQSSAQGGRGVFCPVASAYNQLAATRPDLLGELAKPEWPFDRPPDGVGAFYRRPVMFLGERSGAPEMLFSRGALIRSPQGFRPDDIPRLTHRQAAALDALHFAATTAACRVDYQKGDVLFFNNRRVLHGREGFQDADHGDKRHILRLWLRDEELAGTPPAPLDRLWGDVFAPSGGSGDEAKRWPPSPDCC